LKPIAHGADKGWYASGTRRFERDFDHGQPTGVWRAWHPNGQLASETTFAGATVEMLMSFWYDTGVLSAAGPATNGSRQGAWRFYRPEGSLREEGTYHDSVREGEWTEYDDVGAKARVVYVKGLVLSRQ
jgi:antitoxin component YwqK of YwqJK toxin-antitoxin module